MGIKYNWRLTEDQPKKLDMYYDGFTESLMPKDKKMQESGGSFAHFMTELKLFIKDSDYANCDEMIHCCTEFATYSPNVWEKLLSHGPELKLEKQLT